VTMTGVLIDMAALECTARAATRLSSQHRPACFGGTGRVGA
jgi:hypothetical protein